MVQTYETGYNSTLALPLSATDTTMSVATAPTVTKGAIKLGRGVLEEWVTFTGVSGTTLTGLTRGLSKTAIPATAGTGLSWVAGTPIKLVAMHDQLVDRKEDTSFTGNVTAGGAVTSTDIRFTGTTTSGLRIKTLTTAQRDALTPATGDKIINSTTGTEQTYYGGTWNDNASGTTANASTTVAGKVEEATLAEQGAQTGTGGTGARLFINPENTAKTSAGAGDENKIPLLNASGQLATGFINNKFGGTSADGVQGDSNLTITGSNNTYIVKNFSSWTAGSVTRTCTVTPTGCVVHIKIKGNADFTNWTFDFSGKGAPGGPGTSGGTATVGTSTSLILQLPNTGGGVPGANLTTGGGGGAGNGANGSAAGGSGGVKGNIFPLTAIQGRRCIEIGAGSGGGGGGGNGTGATGGTGGAGGGCLIIEVGGTTTLDNTLTVINMNGAVGGNRTGGGDAGGGGGGGGGSVYLMYTGTLIGTCTPTVAGGAGGTGNGGNGGAGGVGLSLIEANTVFS